jgi:hypothetical protein
MSDNTRMRTSRGRDENRLREFVFLRTSLQRGRVIFAAGGARRDRTDDLLLAKQALSQLSYGPAPVTGHFWVPSEAGNGGPGKI